MPRPPAPLWLRQRRRPGWGVVVLVVLAAYLAEVRWVSLAEADELMKTYGMFDAVHEYLQREKGGAER